MPKAAAKTKRYQRLTVFKKTNTVRIAHTMLRKPFEATINLCGESQSLAAPPTSRKIMRGTVAANRMVPRASPDPVNCRTNHGKATR